MSESTYRRLLILQRIPSRPNSVTNRELLSHIASYAIKADIRTIQRDMTFLTSSGLFGIASELGSDGRTDRWFWMNEKSSGSIPFMDRKSAIAFNLLEQLVSDKIPSTLSTHLSPYFEQSRKWIGESNGWEKRIYFKTNKSEGKREPDQDNNLDMICEAIDENVCLSVDLGRYTDGLTMSYITLNPIHPLGILGQDQHLYILHWRAKPGKVYASSLQHLKNIHILHNTPIHKSAKEFNIQEYADKNSISKVFNRSVEITMTVGVHAARNLLECPISNNQIIESIGDNLYEVTATTVDNSHFRSRIELIKPLNLTKKTAINGSNDN